MEEVSPGPAASPTAPERVGALLRATRERQGLSLTEIASRTRVPLRHLEAIEMNDYAGLPSTTYAAGFARAYARAVGADEVEVARGVRTELAGFVRPKREYIPYELTDPARVPSRGLALTALGLAIAVLVLAGLWFGTTVLRGSTASPAVAPIATAPVAPRPVPPPATGGQVLVTATDEVWVRIYDANDKTLHQGTLKAGEHFEVPADAVDPRINVGRPDKLRVTVNGSLLQGLDLGNQPIKDVRVSAAALAARAAGQPAPQSAPHTASQSAPQPTPSSDANSATRPTTRRASSHRPDRARAAAPSASAETRRANLNAAPSAPPPGNTQ